MRINIPILQVKMKNLTFFYTTDQDIFSKADAKKNYENEVIWPFLNSTN